MELLEDSTSSFFFPPSLRVLFPRKPLPKRSTLNTHTHDTPCTFTHINMELRMSFISKTPHYFQMASFVPLQHPKLISALSSIPKYMN